MASLSEKFQQLKANEKVLVIFASLLILFALGKVFVFDTQHKKLSNLKNRAALIQEQTLLLGKQPSDRSKHTAKASNQVISSFLTRTNNNETLKNIRKTSSGGNRYEINNIQFNIFLDLLSELDKNGSNYSSLQLKADKQSGIIDVIMITE